MNKPILFIETPRAGKHNHRFIIPTDYKDGDSLLSQFADTARQQAEAKANELTEAKANELTEAKANELTEAKVNEAPKPAEAESADTIISTKGIYFLAASKKASQKSGGRIGTEQLILAGVNAKRLSTAQIETIRTFLKERLPDVERLVTQTINWEQATKIIVPRLELNQWLLELEQRLGKAIPAMPQEIKSQFKAKPESKRKWFMEPVSIGIGMMLLASATMVMICKNPSEPLQCINEQFRALNHRQHTGQHDETSPKVDTGLETAKAKAQRLITAIGGNEKDVRKELAPFELPNANTTSVSSAWTNNVGKYIPDSGPWPVSMLFKNVDGNAVTTGLWSKNIEPLQIANASGSLQPLVQCRIAIRNLMGVTGDVYTPFFQMEDFNKNVANLNEKVTQWGNNYSDALRTKGKDCTKQEDKNLVNWINECFNLTGYEDDKELSKIKDVGEKCGAVKFVTQPITPSVIQTKQFGDNNAHHP